MMKKILAAILLGSLLLAPKTAAAEPWSKTEKGLFCALQVLQVADLGQTHWIGEHHGGWTKVERHDWYLEPQERNPLIGEDAKAWRVNLYFAALPVVEYLVVDHSPTWLRTPLLITAIAVEGVVVRRNYRKGLGWTFNF